MYICVYQTDHFILRLVIKYADVSTEFSKVSNGQFYVVIFLDLMEFISLSLSSVPVGRTGVVRQQGIISKPYLHLCH